MPSSEHGTRLLADLGVPLDATVDSDPVGDWAASGAMALTGRADGPPLPVAGPATALRGALAALQALAPHARLPGVGLLGERAAIAGLARRSPSSPGGGTRLLDALDGRVAVTLAREEDRESVPAVVERDGVTEPWAALTSWAAGTPAAQVLERCHLLGLAAAAPGEVAPASPYVVHGDVGTAREVGRPLVVDLSSLWAGPLCCHLLGLTGARVVTVESTRRPDGARRGPAAFRDLLRHGTESVALDLTRRDGVERLRALLVRADVVVEGSRPRALTQLGIEPADVLAAPGDRTWVSITAYGRTGPGADRIGYGDDTAVAAGVLAEGGHLAGDALGDPLAGAHAAVAALAGVRTGGSRLVEVALARVLASVRQDPPGVPAERRDGRWWAGEHLVADPVARTPAGPAPELGRHTDAVLAELC